MTSNSKANEFFNLVASLLPEDLRRSRKDFEKNLKAALNGAFVKMNLVTREEYEIQTELLARTRTLVDELEQKVILLEQQLTNK